MCKKKELDLFVNIPLTWQLERYQFRLWEKRHDRGAFADLEESYFPTKVRLRT
jgi:hypothetical protein